MPPANESGRVPKAVRLPRLFMGRATGLTEQKRYPSHACRLLVTVTVLTQALLYLLGSVYEQLAGSFCTILTVLRDYSRPTSTVAHVG